MAASFRTLERFGEPATALTCVLALLLPLAGQQPGQPSASQKPDPQAATQPVPTFSSNVNVVNVLATVRDKHGQIVSNLTKNDFKLEEDGRPQAIRYFAKETDLPLTLGLLVDTSLSQRRVLDQERSASYTFLEQVLREDKDKAFVIHFDREIELLQDLTSSREKLEAALNKLETPEFTRAGSGGGSGGGGGNGGGSYPGGGYPGGGGHQGGGHHGGGGTTLYDAIFLASDELMQKQHGRKALVVLTDGVDTGSKVTLDRAIEAAQRANTMVYSVLFKDDEAYNNGGGFGGPGMGRHGGWGGMGRGGGGGGGQRYPQTMSHPDGKKVLERISKETGGRLFEVSKKATIQQIYAELQEELRNQYNLGFTPDETATAAGSGYHKIGLTASNKDWIVQARDGYYADGSTSHSQ